ncbi:MAG: hypothetical protein ACLR2E_09760 [Lachnospiraceae bacterium]
MKKHTIHLKSWLVRLILILVTIFMLYPVFWSVYSSFKNKYRVSGKSFFSSLISGMEQLCAGSSEIKFVFQPEKLCLCCGCGPDSDSSSGGAQFLLHCEIPLFR